MAGKPILIIGTGGSGRETLMLLRDIERANQGTWDFRGFAAADEPDPALLARIGAPYLGSPEEAASGQAGSEQWHFVVGIGSGERRRHIEAQLSASGLLLASLIHPSARIGDDVEIGAGSVICANTVITTNVRIGQSLQANIGCVIAHDSRIGDHVTLAQSVNLCGASQVHHLATIYTGAMVLPGTQVGVAAVVGAGAVVNRDVPDGVTVVGVPARPRGQR